MPYKNNANSKVVIQKDLDGFQVAIYPSTAEAARLTGFTRPNISFACRKSVKRYNYFWEFAPIPEISRDEIWKEHPILPIKVSNLGRVDNYRGTKVFGNNNEKGYKGVVIAGKRHLVHRLVLETFIGPCPPKYECDHINRVCHDNRVENLRWVTRVENCANRVFKSKQK
jgi:hypothetical protein